MIPPLNVEMTYSTGHIPYLLSSLSSSRANLSKVSACASFEPLLIESQVSTFVDPPSTTLSSTTLDDTYVNLISQDDASGITTTSCSQSSSHPPISNFDEDIMESMTTHDYSWNAMHHRVYFLPYLESTTLNTSNMPIAYWEGT